MPAIAIMTYTFLFILVIYFSGKFLSVLLSVFQNAFQLHFQVNF